MGHGATAADDSVPKTRYCEQHYTRLENIKKRIRDGKSSGRGHIEETRGADGTENQNVGATSHDTSVTIVEGGTVNIRRKGKIVEIAEGTGEPESSAKTREPLIEFGSMETYKSKCFELSVELEKKKVECAKLQGELAEVVETKKTNATDEAEQTPTDAAERWRKMFSDLESQVWGMENRNSAMAECVESRVSILESLVLRSGKDGSILRCGEIERDETTSGGREYSHLYELKTKEEVLNMYKNLEERKGWGSSEERPSQHGSPSKDLFVNLVSDDDSW